MIPNNNYIFLDENYLFAEIARRVKAFKEQNRTAELIHMGIGDVTLPLCRTVVKALKTAAEEMGESATFHGYGPEQGYEFLREKIKDYYIEKGVNLSLSEIFISDGAKSDLGNILDIFDKNNAVLIPNPVYPVYVDTNRMAGRKILFAHANEQNNFLPMPNWCQKAEIIYLCSPNNPTGAVYNKAQLGEWIDYALKYKALILFDAAYEAFINNPELPRSIFELERAKECAIEFCSLSKTAGFTGTRCGYTVVPENLVYEKQNLNHMWLRRQTTKFNGVSYLIQRGAEAVFSEDGKKEIKENLNYYQRNAKVIAETLRELNIPFTGGENAPYIWLKCQKNMSSFEYFDYLMKEKGIVGTPGAGFGKNGENYFRLSSFSSYENTLEAMRRLKEGIV